MKDRVCPLRRALAAGLLLVAWLSLPLGAALGASDFDEFKVKREQVFEFTEKPTVTRAGDRVTIRFASKGYCDATVAIEDEEGRILRHLASGVLGPNAPEPFQRNSKRQVIIWDGKDDQGRYIDDADALTVRVSLGLRPQFERTLFWSPQKRLAPYPPVICPAEDGVYVFEGRGVDSVKRFDHAGTYVRTIYPFPAARLHQARGLWWHRFPQDILKYAPPPTGSVDADVRLAGPPIRYMIGGEPVLPIKHGCTRMTLLTSGPSSIIALAYKHGYGSGASTMAVRDGRLALAFKSINRLAVDGTTGGRPLEGPEVGITVKPRSNYSGAGERLIGPASAAFSPDGKTLYFTGYLWKYGGSGWVGGALHGVYRAPFEGDGPATVFAGEMAQDGYGSDNAHFTSPTAVACDAKGRVYVADYLNDRIQVFSPEGKFLKSIPSRRPAMVMIHERTQEIYVASFFVFGVPEKYLGVAKDAYRDNAATLTRYGPFDDPRQLATYVLPTGPPSGMSMYEMGHMFEVALDSWTDPPTLWVATRKRHVTAMDVAYSGMGAHSNLLKDEWAGGAIRLFAVTDEALRLKRDFGRDARKAVVRTKPPDNNRQRLYVNPRRHVLYVAEDLGSGKSFKELVRIDPETGRVRLVELPFDTEDLAFDLNGLAYLRTDTVVVRYDPETWREVPWDYGEERRKVGFSSLGGGKRADVASGLRLTGNRPVCWHMGGIGLSARGLLAVACCSQAKAERRETWKEKGLERRLKPYLPTMFPGRLRWGEVHVYDGYGRIVRQDAVPGLQILDGLQIDRNGDLYVMAAPSRVLDGTPYFNFYSETLMKVTPGKSRVFSDSPRAAIPLAESDRLKRPYDIAGRWVDGAHWFYGGLGYGGFNGGPGGGCACANARFCLDYFARSFAPEVDHYSVAVLDTNGNLITRIGRYGNVDDGRPLETKGGPPDPRPIGGDEVALFNAAYVGTDTDRRLFIADAGNQRIVSVKLGYNAAERVALKDVSETKP